jgi:phosphomevalonate kinase
MPDGREPPVMIATAPGKLIITGEYAVLDGAPALVVAVDRRAIARLHAIPRGSSPFLVAVADEIAARRGPGDPATRAALEISVDSTAFYERITKLGLGSSAAVTVAATALALDTVDRGEVLEVALAAHARAQGPRGARGSGADIAASVHGGTLVFSRAGESAPCRIEHRKWPAQVALVPFFTGVAADTAQLVARMQAARAASPAAVDAALTAIADASRAACAALTAPPELATLALIGAIALAANATDRLAIATGVDLVPECVTRARSALARHGGTAKTTGAGGGDVGVAVIPATVDATLVTRLLIEAGCQPLRIALDDTGVDLRADAS